MTTLDADPQSMSHTVVYIEDDAANIALVDRLLSTHPDTTLHTATTALDGVRLATELRPTLILLDNRLPDATGREVLVQLKAAEATAGIPVIILTGDSGRRTSDELLALGASAFLAKPFDIHAFNTLIEAYLH